MGWYRRKDEKEGIGVLQWSLRSEPEGRDHDSGVSNNIHRSLVYVEGDATMNTYRTAEGKNRSSLNIVEREFSSPSRSSWTNLSSRQIRDLEDSKWSTDRGNK